MKIYTKIRPLINNKKILAFDTIESFELEKHEKGLEPLLKERDEAIQEYIIKKNDLLDSFLVNSLETEILEKMQKLINEELFRRKYEFAKQRYNENGLLRGDK